MSAETTAKPVPMPFRVVAVVPAVRLKPVATPTSSPAPVPAQPPRWTVRKGSSITFDTVWSGGPVHGGFTRWTADIRFDPAASGASTVAVTVDMASVTTGATEQESALPSEEWFASALHPTAVFKSADIQAAGNGIYLARGTLTPRGRTLPLSLPFQLSIGGSRASMQGSVSIDRTAFAVGQGEWASTADLPAMVKVVVMLKADKGR